MPRPTRDELCNEADAILAHVGLSPIKRHPVKKTKKKKPTKPRAKIRHSRRANALMTQFIPLAASRTHRVAIHTGLADGLAEFEARGREAERAVSKRKDQRWTVAAQKLYAHIHSMGSRSGIDLFNQELRPLMDSLTPASSKELFEYSPKAAAHLKLRERATNLLRKMPSHAPEGSRSWEGAIADVIEALKGADQ